LLLQVIYTIRSERQLVEQFDYNVLYHWFVGLGIDESVWDRTVFCANRDYGRLFRSARSLKLHPRHIDAV